MEDVLAEQGLAALAKPVGQWGGREWSPRGLAEMPVIAVQNSGDHVLGFSNHLSGAVGGFHLYFGNSTTDGGFEILSQHAEA